nr:MAG TPA: hypothetical protein [Caudoviricetes sp.]
MKIDKEQVEKMAQVMCGFCTEDKRCVLKYSAPCSDIASQDCSCKESAEELICKGYGNVDGVRKKTAKEVLDMLYDMGIDKETLECCKIFDVNGVSLAKQICEKYSVEIEK